VITATAKGSPAEQAAAKAKSERDQFISQFDPDDAQSYLRLGLTPPKKNLVQSYAGRGPSGEDIFNMIEEVAGGQVKGAPPRAPQRAPVYGESFEGYNPDGSPRFKSIEIRPGVEFNKVPPAASQPSASQKKALDEVESMENLIKRTAVSGAKASWGGTGKFGIGAGKEFAKQAFGKGDDGEAAYRTDLSNIYTKGAHANFGSAFTRTEKGLIDKTLPWINMHGEAVKIKLQGLWELMQDEREAITGKRLPYPGDAAMLGGRAAGAGPGGATGFDFRTGQFK
jgi:hypothetical protein